MEMLLDPLVVLDLDSVLKCPEEEYMDYWLYIRCYDDSDLFCDSIGRSI